MFTSPKQNKMDKEWAPFSAFAKISVKYPLEVSNCRYVDPTLCLKFVSPQE